jgi:hypothetical protein
MAKDYYQHHLEDDFSIKLRDNNIIKTLDLNLCPRGRTGYEQYYHDIEGFWRTLYLPPYDNTSRIFTTLDAYDITDTDAYYNESSVMEIVNKNLVLTDNSVDKEKLVENLK